MKYMLDTNICIYAMNKRSGTVLSNLKSHLTDGLCISAIVLAELEHGIAKSAYPERSKAALMKILSIFDILDFDANAAVAYGIIQADLQRKGMPISPLDTLIAAHAKAAGLTLVTNNMREFERVSGLPLENWTEN
ncbi:MAG: type II toxin-antitoxin system VapC family toxin [Oscillospiraceae bacterium]|nr:type II toxin-antitoxin system VapC family toxin [Oscillospiraceae bacterium]